MERGVRPMGDWSILMTLSSLSIPYISRCFPGTSYARFRSLASLLYRISFMSELLPEPETPVTQVNTPVGMSTSTDFRLLAAAPRIFSQPDGFLLSRGTGINSEPLR